MSLSIHKHYSRHHCGRSRCFLHYFQFFKVGRSIAWLFTVFGHQVKIFLLLSYCHWAASSVIRLDHFWKFLVSKNFQQNICNFFSFLKNLTPMYKLLLPILVQLMETFGLLLLQHLVTLAARTKFRIHCKKNSEVKFD